jgi:hypothetical protein
VVAEDLNVAGMIRNRRLARALADQGFAAARRMFDYKTGWNGGDAYSGGPLVSLIQDLLWLRYGENQAVPVRACLPMRRLRPGP